MMAEMMREQTMREVSKAGEARRPAGISHVLPEKNASDADAGPQYAAKYDEDSDEWGGPKGARELLRPLATLAHALDLSDLVCSLLHAAHLALFAACA